MLYNYQRRDTHEVKVGCIGIGGSNRVVIQSMANTDTNAVEDSAEQAIRIAEAGGELVRFTTQGVREALSLGEIRELIRKKGIRFQFQQMSISIPKPLSRQRIRQIR